MFGQVYELVYKPWVCIRVIVERMLSYPAFLQAPRAGGRWTGRFCRMGCGQLTGRGPIHYKEKVEKCLSSQKSVQSLWMKLSKYFKSPQEAANALIFKERAFQKPVSEKEEKKSPTQLLLLPTLASLNKFSSDRAPHTQWHKSLHFYNLTSSKAHQSW